MRGRAAGGAPQEAEGELHLNVVLDYVPDLTQVRARSAVCCVCADGGAASTAATRLRMHVPLCWSEK